MPSLRGKLNPSYRHGHGAAGEETRIYLRHRNMILRCYCVTSKDYPSYGGRGITVCDRWHWGENGKSGFECFYEDMGDIPFEGATLDRIDGTKGYSKENCRWATVEEQANNKRTSRLLTIDGKTLTVKQWSRISGVGDKTILYRLKRNVPPEKAVFMKPDRSTALGERYEPDPEHQPVLQADQHQRI
jgi:hypothetical protein